MLNRLAMAGPAWAVNSTTVTTVADQAEYTITPSGSLYGFGRPMMVYRDLGDNVYLPVPFTDYQHELSDQGHEFWIAPQGTEDFIGWASSKVAFLRTGDNPSVVKMRVYPTPEEAGTVFTVLYQPGYQDPAQMNVSNSPVMPEWSHLKCLWAAATLLDACEWAGKTDEQNERQAAKTGKTIEIQLRQEEPRFDAFIRNPQNEVVTDSGYWWE